MKSGLLFLCAAVVAAVGAETVSNPVPEREAAPKGQLSASARLGIKFNPAAKAPDEASVDSPPAAPTDPVAPGTVVLPPFLVNETRLKLAEKDMLTDKGRLDLAEKRHISPLYRTTFGPLAQLATYYFCWPSIFGGWHPNEAEAMTLYRQDERLLMLDEMDSLIRLETALDPKATKQFQRIRFGAEVTSR